MKKISILLCGLAAVWLAGMVGCDDGGDPSILQLKVKAVPAEVTYGGASTDPKANAYSSRVTITGPGMDDVVQDYQLGIGGSGTGKLPDFPEGYDRQVTFEFLGAPDPLANGAQKVISRGRTSSLDLWRGERALPLNLFVAPVNAMVPPTQVDSNTGVVTQSAPVNANRVGASFTELDDGRILICGGARVKADAKTWYLSTDLYELSNVCEFYNPRNGEFSELTTRMGVKRAYHQAIKLGSPNNPDGRVVLFSGYSLPDGGVVGPTPSVEIFNPETNTFITAPSPLPGNAGRALFTADLINPDEDYIAVFGGVSNFKSAGGTWDIFWVTEGDIKLLAHGFMSPAGSSTGATIRYNHSMVKVSGFADELTQKAGYQAYLLIGGENESGIVGTIEPFVILCPSRSQCSIQRQDALVIPIQNSGRTLATSIYDRKHNIVWIAGGFKDRGLVNPIDRVEAYRVSKANFAKKGDGTSADEHLKLSSARGGMAVAEMSNGEFLFTGGSDGTNRVTAIEAFGEAPYVYEGQTVQIPAFVKDFPVMETPRAGHVSIVDQTGRVLLMGGVSTTNGSPDPMMYNPAD